MKSNIATFLCATDADHAQMDKMRLSRGFCHLYLLFISKVDISLTQNIIENDLFRLMDDNSPIHDKSFNIDNLPKEIIDFVQTYGDFKEDTRLGLNGIKCMELRVNGGMERNVWN